MKRIDSPNARENVNGAGKKGFHDNADLSGQDATYLTPSWCNSVQEEICGVIEQHEPLNNSNNNQLKDALFSIFATNQNVAEVDSRLSSAIVALSVTMQQAIINERNAERNRIWPIGKGRYTTYDGLNPAEASHLGWGTWVLDTASSGRVLIGAGTTTDTRDEERTYSAGATGGEFSHVQAENEIAKHVHREVLTPNSTGLNPTNSQFDLSTNQLEPSFVSTLNNDLSGYLYDNFTAKPWDWGAAGDSAAMNIMQPYLVVSVWVRTG